MSEPNQSKDGLIEEDSAISAPHVQSLFVCEPCSASGAMSVSISPQHPRSVHAGIAEVVGVQKRAALEGEAGTTASCETQQLNTAGSSQRESP